MFIILYAHIPNGEWVNWIPARFGFSDATEIFVCCSGFASAYAFGAAFVKAGWRIGATRIAYRVWQVYWVHVGVFIAIVAMLGAIDARLGTAFLGEELNLAPFLANPGGLMGHFLTLTYVPNFFDILPMYLVILALVPLMMALAQWSLKAVAAVSVALWLAANLHFLDLPAEPWSDRGWFFDPFAWQLVFFTGFAFAMRWLPAPPRDRRLMTAAIVVLALVAPFSCQDGFACYAGWGHVQWLADVGDAIPFGLRSKTYEGVLRYGHFLALAYVAFCLVGENGRNLRGWFVEAMMRVGRQTLAAFVTGLILAQLIGVILAVYGAGFVMQTITHLAGSVALFCAAITVEYFKTAGMRHKPLLRADAPRPTPASGAVADGEPARAA